jgi:ferrous iron transport protein B
MMDVAEQEGIRVEPRVLEAALGVPVVPMSATRRQGLDELVETVDALLADEVEYQPRRPTILEDHQIVLAELLTLIGPYVPEPYPQDWVALKMLEGDVEILSLMEGALPPAIWERAHKLVYQHEDAILDVAGARYEWIERMVRAAVARPKVGQVGLTARLDRVLTHPLWGSLVLLGVLGFVFWLTYALGTPLQEWLGGLLDGLGASLEATLSPAWPAWSVSLLTSGVIGGAGMVVTFLPILVIFFTALAILEDTGYLARVAYLTDRFMHALGLHGKSFIPLLLGFGCNVPAVLGTRIIETRRARLMTILLAPLVPCTARMAVVTVLTPVFFDEAAGLVAWGLVAGNVVVLALLGLALHHLVFQGEQVAFVMELPLYHVPNARTIGLYVWRNVVAFLRKAGTIILGVSVLIWALSYFPTGVATESYLATVGQWLEPVGEWMGLSWKLMTALLTSFIAKENTIATLGVLYGDFETQLSMLLSPAAALAFLTVQMLFIPCVATVATIKQEVGWRWTLISSLLLVALSFGGGVLVYHAGSALLGG